jgi:toxin-antitoxin system PIN domain toxin
MLLPDVNVWLALAFERHAHHVTAKSWFTEVPDAGCAFCRMTQQGFFRLASNPRVFEEDALSLSGAWWTYDALLGDPRVRFADESADLESIWREYTRGQAFSPKVWNDAYLAAFARTARYELVTFDRGFRQYPELVQSILQ